MGFWIFMLIMDLLIPLVMIVGGKLMAKVPKKINYFYGYRTAMSMKNQETWAFAHKHCGRNWFRVGLVMLPLSVIAMLFLIDKDTDTVGIWGGILCVVQTLALIASIFPTEKALRQTFDNDGNLK